VIAVDAQVGARIEKGQILARLDDAEQRAALAAADAKRASSELLGIRAERDLLAEIDRQQEQGLLPELPLPDELLEGRAGDIQLEYLHDAAQVEKDEAAVSLARTMLGRRAVRSPIRGVVLARNIEAGESIPASPPGLPLFVLGSDPKRLRLEVEVDERYARAVQPGPATFVVPSHGSRAFSASVRQVIAAAGGARSPAPYVVVLDVPNGDGALDPGMSAIAELTMTTGRETLLVPARALSSHGEGAAVWLPDEHGRPVAAPVTAGVANVDFVEVQGPAIDAGRVVVTDVSPSTCVVAPPISPFAGEP
jgi:HlyD family secretion protein